MPGRLSELANSVRTQSTTSVELITRSLQRINDAREINAVVCLRSDEALAEAHALDRAIAAGQTIGPLAGLPALIKDVEDVEGLPTTFGSLIYKNAPPAKQDGLMAKRLRRAGAIVVGKTNTSELAAEGYTANPLFGITRNPWAPEWSPGGSSGGSAAALAAGLAAIASGTDIGGSVRCPAAFCGLVGLKPSNGLIGRDSILPSMELNNHGLFGWTIADVRTLLAVLEGPAPGDPSCLPLDLSDHDRFPAKGFVVKHLFPDVALDPEVEKLFESAVSAIEATNRLELRRIRQSDVFPQGYAPDDFGRILGPELVYEIGADRIAESSDLLDPPVRSILQGAERIGFQDYLAARKRRLSYTRQLDDLLGEDAILLTPTLSVPGWLADGRLLGATQSGVPPWAYNTEPPNLTGHPALSVPAGLHSNGVPFGLEIIGPRFNDHLILNFGAFWESLAPWRLLAPGYEPLN